VFPNGTLTVRHEPQTKSQSFDGRTCVGTYSETGTYDITKGTGMYKHVTGSGHYKVSAVFQGCAKNAPPMAFSQVIQAHGPLFLG
jgi:predicted lipoprotein with Yx(FWY)xxD motif